MPGVFIFPLVCEPTKDLSLFDIFHYPTATGHGPPLIDKNSGQTCPASLTQTVEFWTKNNPLVICTSGPDGRNNGFSSPRESGVELPGAGRTKATLDLGPTVSLTRPQSQSGPENARSRQAASRSSGNQHARPRGLLN